MKAIVVEEYGAVDKLLYKDFAKPTADKDTVVVKNHSIGKNAFFRHHWTGSCSNSIYSSFFTGLNMIDTYHRSGLYPLPLPFVMGRDG